MKNITEKDLSRGRALYNLEAMLEYLISIVVAGAYLATLTKELGFSDSLTGILSSIISLGCLFQLLTIFFKPKTIKKTVIVLSVLNQLLFMFLYIIPLLEIPSGLKISLFVFSIITAYLLYNIAHPKKIAWLMSLVDDSYRGKFTANKEIISLLSGMVFSFVMGSVTDKLAAEGRIRTAFIVSGSVIFLIMVLHTLSMVFTVEKQAETKKKSSLKESVKYLLGNKNVLMVALVFVIYYIANYASVPFHATYKIHELGFSLQFISILTIISSFSRILVSKFWGVYADKTSFARMIEKCFIVLVLSFTCVAFAVPGIQGKIMFTLFYLTHGAAMGGINSALINLVFDYVPEERRSDSLAVCQSLAGTVGFITTLLISPIVASVQSSGNTVFGFHIYAQQILSIVSIIFTVLAIIFVRKFMIKKG